MLIPGLPPFAWAKTGLKAYKGPPFGIFKNFLIQFLDTIQLFIQFKGVFSVRFCSF
jgi:hypothetical protein